MIEVISMTVARMKSETGSRAEWKGEEKEWKGSRYQCGFKLVVDMRWAKPQAKPRAPFFF